MISIVTLLIYLVKATAAMSAFYVVFALFLCRNTFFRLNRFYLLSGILFSFTIPFLSFPLGNEIVTIPGIFKPISGEALAFEDEVHQYISEPDAQPVDVSLVLGLVYLSGFIFLLLRNGNSFIQLSLLTRSNRVRKIRRAMVVPIDTDYSFSFLNILFLSRTQNQRAVIAHERAHLRQNHWIDLLVSSLACIILWFNPISWFYSRAIRQQHEYLADNEVLRQGFSLKQYLELILNSLSVDRTPSLIHRFNSTSLKNRIIMMTQKKSSRIRTLLYLSMAPIFALSLFAFGKKELSAGHSLKSLTVVIDASHGGDDHGASSGTLREKDLSLTFARLIRSACEEKGITCVMTRQDDRTIALKERLESARATTPDLFISIHFSSDANEAKGMNILVSKENQQYDKSVKLGSLLLAELQSLQTTGGIHHSSALLLKENRVPSVILDLGNLAHEKDRALINNRVNQEEISERIAKAVRNFEN